MTHFYASIPEHLRKLTDAQAVAEFVARADVPGKAIAGLSPKQLASYPVPGTWSIAQIVVHLMDSDMIASYRMKRIIAEERPRLDIWDEVAFSHRLFYNGIDAAQAAEVFRLNRLLVGQMLRQLPAEAFSRIALHPEMGDMSLGQYLRIYVNHVDHHLPFIQKKRALVESGAAS
jgi:hypothetical protein